MHKQLEEKLKQHFLLSEFELVEFEALIEDTAGGVLKQPEKNDIDENQLQVDTAMLTTVYTESMQDIPGGPREALIACTLALFEEDSTKGATVLQTYDSFEGVGTHEGMSVEEAIRALALAVQSTVEGSVEQCAAKFSLKSSILTTTQLLRHKHRKDSDSAVLIEKLLPLTLLKDTFCIPFKEDEFQRQFDCIISAVSNLLKILKPFFPL